VRRLLAAALFLAIAASAPAALAQPSAAGDADRLFDEGRRLLDAGRAAEACPYFERSQELDPGRGTLINIAACYEAVGRLVDALRVFRDVQQQSEQAHDTPRAAAARRRISEIAARIPHLTLEVATPRPEGFVVAVDRLETNPDQWPDLLVDPGMVEIVASAPGYRAFETTATVAADGSHVTVAIPALQRATASIDSGAAPALRRDRHRTILGLSIAGGGVVLVGAASALALAAKSSYDDALAEECNGDPDRCTVAGVDRTDRARTRGNVATAIGAVGLAAVAGGLIVWLTAPTEAVEPGPLSIAPLYVDGGGGLAVSGAF